MKKRILVIEDNEDICKLLHIRLENRGYDVTTAPDGQTGLERATLGMPDLIILDLFLPRLPGEEVCKAIREHRNKAVSKIPIIMLTSKRSEVDRIIGMVIGANAYMEKPFDPERLMEQIQRQLN
ncbi:MAG TPA: response regulator [Candidatus Eisenbacteria bacterium]|nr:response regulator [Candidatus Eisenbacteria bacterium]